MPKDSPASGHAPKESAAREHVGSRNANRDDVGTVPVRVKDSGLGMGWFYALSVYVSRVVAVTLFEARFFDTHKVPRSGAALLAGNHQSLLDPWLLGLSLARRASFLARDSLFRVPVLGWLLRQYDSMPVPRESTAPRRSLEVCVKLLEKGRVLILFPEGTRAADGRLQPLKRGIALISKRTCAPVVPVLVSGAFALWPRSRKLPMPGQVRLVFGDPIHFDPKESSDAFMDRLSAAYRHLALEWGAEEMVPEASCTEGDANAAASSINRGELLRLPEAAGAA
jgi:1-acyl-sn-glycerol-3-phosphate acyltransferase